MTPHFVAGGIFLEGSVWVRLGYAAQLALGVVFAASALTKLRAPRAFVQTVSEYGVLPQLFAPPVALAVISAETLLATCLLANVVPRVALLGALATFVTFLGVVGTSLLRGRYVSCGCFGDTDEVISATTLVRLVLLEGAAAFASAVLLASAHVSFVAGRGLFSTDAPLATIVVTIVLTTGALVAGAWAVRWREVAAALSPVEPAEREVT
jgi:hypothetical protein